MKPDKPDIEHFDGRKFLSFLKSGGIVLTAGPGGKIRFDAPAGKFTPELRAIVAEHRGELLALLASGSTAPQDLQAHGDAAAPVTAGSDPSDAGPSGTDRPDRPAGQALPGAVPHGADGSQDDRGDALQAHGAASGADGSQGDHWLMGPTSIQTGRAPLQVRGVDTHFLAHGWQDGSQDPAAAPQATAGPRPRAAVPVAIEWPAAAADFALLLAPDDLPPAPFNLNPWTAVQDAAKFLRWLRADIRRGPSGPRAFYGALQSDLLALQRFALAAADDRQRRETRKAGEA